MSLKIEFDMAMHNIYVRALKEAGYKASKFLQMLTKDRGILTAKKLINMSPPSDGYTALYLKNRLDLTVEAVVIDDPKWHSLFTDQELKKADDRLIEYQYKLN